MTDNCSALDKLRAIVSAFDAENYRTAQELIERLGEADCRALLAASLVARSLTPGAALELRPMETAPRDGTHILLWWKDDFSGGVNQPDVACWVSDGLFWLTDNDVGVLWSLATGWLPVPKLPKEI